MGNPFNTTTKLLASSLLLLSPALAGAAGLGKLSVLSALGQPLKVEIDVVALQQGELASLNARVASPEVFRKSGVEYGAVIPHIRAAIEPRNGGAVITLRSQQPIDEPFVDVLIELDSQSGALVRQYTFLLDPVDYQGPQPIVSAPVSVAQPAAAPEQLAPAATPIAVESLPASAPAMQGAPALAETAPAPVAQAAPQVAAEPAAQPVTQRPATHEVKSGDTLSKIALANKPADVSLQQMLVALQRANEDAFIEKNMNLMRVGKILRIPEPEAARQIDQGEAVRVVNTHTRDFSDYRARLAAEVAAADVGGAVSQQQASGRITTQVQEQPAPAAVPQDELRLSKGAEGAGVTAGTVSGDDAAASAKALNEANERVTELERNLNDLQKLLELKNQQLAQLQASATPADSAPAAAETPVEASSPEVAEAQPAAATIEEAKVEAPAETPAAEAEPAPVVEAPASEAVEPKAEAATPIAKTEPEPKPKKAKKAAPPPPQPEPSFLDTLLDDPMLLAGGGGAVVAMLIGLLIYRRRRAATLDNSLIGMTTTDSSSVFGTTGGRNIDTGASSLQTDFSQSAIGSIDTEEVDPVAEADVYMAYGRDAQAEEILKEALQKDPSRLAVRLKLLEIYAARKDLKAFETTASDIYASTGGQGADWDKVVSLGRSIDPNNPLYGAPQASAAAVAAAAASDAVAPAPASVEEPAVAEEPAPAAPMLDLDLDTGAVAEPVTPDVPVEPNVSQALDLDLDLNLGEPTPAAPQAKADEPMDFSPSGTFIMDAETKKAVSELSESQSLDIDLGAPTLEPKDARKSDAGMALDFKLDDPALEAPKMDVPAVDLSGLSLDLDAPGSDAGDSTYQEVATKLDLAKAYEEMGDKDGARELLNEVIKEGDDSQQAQARSMLEAIR